MAWTEHTGLAGEGHVLSDPAGLGPAQSCPGQKAQPSWSHPRGQWQWHLALLRGLRAPQGKVSAAFVEGETEARCVVVVGNEIHFQLATRGWGHHEQKQPELRLGWIFGRAGLAGVSWDKEERASAAGFAVQQPCPGH